MFLERAGKSNHCPEKRVGGAFRAIHTALQRRSCANSNFFGISIVGRSSEFGMEVPCDEMLIHMDNGTGQTK